MGSRSAPGEEDEGEPMEEAEREHKNVAILDSTPRAVCCVTDAFLEGLSTTYNKSEEASPLLSSSKSLPSGEGAMGGGERRGLLFAECAAKLWGKG